MNKHEEITAIEIRLRSTMYPHVSVFDGVSWPGDISDITAYRDAVFDYLSILTAGYPTFNILPSPALLPVPYRDAVKNYPPMQLWEMMAEEYGRLQVMAIRISDMKAYGELLNIPPPR